MIILFFYDYIDALAFEPVKVRVKCRLIFANSDEAANYVNGIRLAYNPNNLQLEDKTRIRKLKLDDYSFQTG